ncbi:hypothetical protein HPB47_019218 [Ixodes persulcatus]|uniref:Uncharacterized protein n=1 Tax=Ixodes persulcatus TaxID=34615 RepID=A0AC60QIT3_IXOPE|nr:hypothetical protein HPB47_019218 [Ixodes persulcatus]
MTSPDLDLGDPDAYGGGRRAEPRTGRSGRLVVPPVVCSRKTFIKLWLIKSDPVPDLAALEGEWESTDGQGRRSIACQVSGFEWWQPEVHCRGGTDGDATIVVAPTAAETPPDGAATDPIITEEAAGYEDGESNAPSQVAADVPAVRRRGRPRKLIPHQCFSRPPLVATDGAGAATDPIITEGAAGYEDGESNAPPQVAADVPAVRRPAKPRRLTTHRPFLKKTPAKRKTKRRMPF